MIGANLQIIISQYNKNINPKNKIVTKLHWKTSVYWVVAKPILVYLSYSFPLLNSSLRHKSVIGKFLPNKEQSPHCLMSWNASMSVWTYFRPIIEHWHMRRNENTLFKLIQKMVVSVRKMSDKDSMVRETKVRPMHSLFCNRYESEQ